MATFHQKILGACCAAIILISPAPPVLADQGLDFASWRMGPGFLPVAKGEGELRSPQPSLIDQNITEAGRMRDEERVRFRTHAVIAAGVLGVAAYGANAWWHSGLTGDFGFTNEGWFGQDTYAGGADKVAHGYAGYVATRLLARGVEWAGNDADRALRLGTITALGIMTGVEIMDGFDRDNKFSYEDALMNVAGVGLAVWLEKNRRWDELLDFRLQYWPADARRRAGETKGKGDYDGHTYLLAAKASGVPALRDASWLRYLELTVGYGTVGYEGTQAGSRFLYYGVSLNLAEILANTVFRNTSKEESRVRRMTETALELLQVPGTALLADHRF
ncbi:MAG: DUF2279 domain-containing protein [Gammaproteobacteria bacterium]|nr:DUF2279 domain-containing protein [Gammaproteobacteria bacterium]